jgi:hypothetical protein
LNWNGTNGNAFSGESIEKIVQIETFFQSPTQISSGNSANVQLHSLLHELKIVRERLLRHRTLTQLQIGCRVVMDVINAHLILNRESAHRRVLVATCIVIAGRDESVARQNLRLSS